MLFASYSSIDRDRIATVLADLRALGHDVWLDEQLSGGQLWWDEILGHIRTCDAFLFLVTPASVASEACLAELGYAQDLGRTVIPIELEAMNAALLPSALGQHQLVSYTEGSRAELMALSRALGRLADGRPLPDPLPPPPPLPGGYFSTLRDQITTADALTLEQQLGVLHRLRARADDGSSEEILSLLATFRRLDDVYASVAEEADELRDAVASAAASAPATMAPARGRGRGRPDDLLGWLTLVLAGAGVLAGLLAMRDPLYSAGPDTVVTWEDDRWFVLLLVVAFAVVMAFGLVTTGRARRVASVVALVVALFALLSWWLTLGDVLREEDIATNSGPITLGPGMNWTAATAGLQVLAAVLLVVAAFSRPRARSPVATA